MAAVAGHLCVEANPGAAKARTPRANLVRLIKCFIVKTMGASVNVPVVVKATGDDYLAGRPMKLIAQHFVTT